MTAVAAVAAIWGAFLLGLRLDQSGDPKTLAHVKSVEWCLGLGLLGLAAVITWGPW